MCGRHPLCLHSTSDGTQLFCHQVMSSKGMAYAFLKWIIELCIQLFSPRRTVVCSGGWGRVEGVQCPQQRWAVWKQWKMYQYWVAWPRMQLMQVFLILQGQRGAHGRRLLLLSHGRSSSNNEVGGAPTPWPITREQHPRVHTSRILSGSGLESSSVSPGQQLSVTLVTVLATSMRSLR